MSETQSIDVDLPGETTTEDPPAQETQEIQGTGPQETLEVPEKFQNEDGTPNVGALLESYRQLEQRQGSEPAAPEAAPAAEAPAETPAGLEREVPLSEALVSYADEFNRDGGLSDESYKALAEKYNVDRAAVDRFIEGEKAIADRATAEIFDLAGGKDKYQEVLQWVHKTEGAEATDALTKRLGDMMGAADREGIKREMQGVMARYAEATRTGWAPELTGNDPAGRAIQPFASEAEMMRAQQEQGYIEGDEAVHRLFDQRLKLSLDMGTIQ